VGIADSVAKPVAYHLLEPALGLLDRVHMICHEGKFPELLAQLTLHRLDLVIADEPVSRKVGVKAFNHALGTSAMSFFCAPSLARQLHGPFPQCLHRAPMLIQCPTSSVRQQLDHWFIKYQSSRSSWRARRQRPHECLWSEGRAPPHQLLRTKPWRSLAWRWWQDL
jgi:LysR family transcriptional activator of nhaA